MDQSKVQYYLTVSPVVMNTARLLMGGEPSQTECLGFLRDALSTATNMIVEKDSSALALADNHPRQYKVRLKDHLYIISVQKIQGDFTIYEDGAISDESHIIPTYIILDLTPITMLQS